MFRRCWCARDYTTGRTTTNRRRRYRTAGGACHSGLYVWNTSAWGDTCHGSSVLAAPGPDSVQGGACHGSKEGWYPYELVAKSIRDKSVFLGPVAGKYRRSPDGLLGELRQQWSHGNISIYFFGSVGTSRFRWCSGLRRLRATSRLKLTMFAYMGAGSKLFLNQRASRWSISHWRNYEMGSVHALWS